MDVTSRPANDTDRFRANAISSTTLIDKPTRVLLLRHADTAAPQLFHGAESDLALSERGPRGAEAIAPSLALQRPAAVISSPMRRAVETATPIAWTCGLSLRVEKDLHERRIGALCGQPYDAIAGPWAETLRRWQAGDLSHATVGAESFVDIRDRVMPVWSLLAETFKGETFVVVTHGAVIRVLLLCLNLGFTFWGGFSCPNLSLYELRMRPGHWRLACNGLGHVKSGDSDAHERRGEPET